MNKAVFLMTYEMIVCFVVVAYVLNNNKRVHNRNKSHGKVTFKIYGFLLLSLTGACVLLWFAFPVVQGNYRTVFELFASKIKDNPYTYYDYVGVGSAERIGSTLFEFLFSFIRILLPAYIIQHIYYKHPDRTLGLFLCLIVIGLQFLFISGAVAYTLVTTLVLFIFTANMYTKHRTKLYAYVSIICVVFVVALFSLKYAESTRYYGMNSMWEYLSQWFNSYFSGVDNVSASFFLPAHNKMRSFLYTLYTTIPFRNTLFPLEGESIVTLFTGMSGLGGQIPSTIGIGNYYFTAIFAPIISAITTYFSVQYSIRYELTANKWKKITYIYLALLMSQSVGMYNIVIVLTAFVQRIIPMLIISSFASDEHENHNTDKIGAPI
ncbi:MAG: hypothetical protein AB7C91_11210 [Sphaerochaeta sp.]|uniref:hypothetical protein n=1 Tax=Sphaerochaeta sp. TaxID=1972642 RepID=UPI003D0D71F4